MTNVENFKNFIESFEVYCKIINKDIIIKKTTPKEKYINYYLGVFDKDIILRILIIKSISSNVVNSISIHLLNDSIFFESIATIIPENKKLIESFDKYINNKKIENPHYCDKITSNYMSSFNHHIFYFNSNRSFDDFFANTIIKII